MAIVPDSPELTRRCVRRRPRRRLHLPDDRHRGDRCHGRLAAGPRPLMPSGPLRGRRDPAYVAPDRGRGSEPQAGAAELRGCELSPARGIHHHSGAPDRHPHPGRAGAAQPPRRRRHRPDRHRQRLPSVGVRAGLLDDLLAVRPRLVWLQVGCPPRTDGARRLETEGIAVVMDRCLAVDHQFLGD